MDLEISEAISVFVQLAKQKNARLEHGAKLRQEMHQAIKDGKRPTGYRADWLRNSAATVVALLGDIARKFDDEHPDDRCSVTDLRDVIATVAGLLEKQSE